jgi:hypothetical protein
MLNVGPVTGQRWLGTPAQAPVTPVMMEPWMGLSKDEEGFFDAQAGLTLKF